MNSSKKIKMALAYLGKSEAWLAKEFGTTASNFNQRMKKDKFSTEELERIADLLGAKYEHFFKFEDGTTI